MNITIVGERGYLGSYLMRRLQEDDYSKYEGDYVINCAGLVSVEISEQDPDRSFNSNAKLVRDLIKKYPDRKLISFSSYYVYDEPEVLCDELSKTTEAYAYMRHKLIGEKYALIAGGLCFRLGKLYGHPDLNRQERLTECLIKNSEGFVLDNVIFNPTSLETVYTAIRFELLNQSLYGLFNLSDDGVTSHSSYGEFVLKCLNRRTPILRVDKTEKTFHNYGNFAMDIGKIKRIISLSHWTENMERYVSTLKGAGNAT
jgi:dTDP-4-dehydrorhamnose reductase